MTNTASIETVPEFAISRMLNVPRESVWKAWTEAARLEKWWGPKGSTVRVVALDVRPGGIFHYAMQFKPGHDIWGRFIYREIVAPERMVYVSAFSDAAGGVTRAPFFDGKWPLEILNTLTLTAQGGKTLLALRAHPLNARDDELKTFTGAFDSMRQGFGGSFEQLDSHLSR